MTKKKSPAGCASDSGLLGRNTGWIIGRSARRRNRWCRGRLSKAGRGFRRIRSCRQTGYWSSWQWNGFSDYRRQRCVPFRSGYIIAYLGPMSSNDQLARLYQPYFTTCSPLLPQRTFSNKSSICIPIFLSLLKIFFGSKMVFSLMITFLYNSPP